MAANDEPIDPKAPYAAFARRLEAAMRASGVSASAIQQECKVAEETVRLWRRGERMPRDKNLKTIAMMVDVDEAMLRYGIKKGETPTLSQRDLYT